MNLVSLFRKVSSPASRIAAYACFLVAAFSMFFYAYRIFKLPDETRIQFLPDDAFYYLILGRNFVSHGQWTFDAGNSVTSGFHLFWAYILAAFNFLFHPGDQVYVQSLIVFAGMITALVAGFCFYVYRSTGSYSVLLATGLVASSTTVLVSSVSLTEWPLVVLFASLYAWTVYRSGEEGHSKNACGLAFAFALMGSLSRSDFGLFPFCVFLAAFVHFLFRQGSRQLLKIAVCGLCGAATGVIVVFLNNLIFTGNCLPGSAQVKYLWSQKAGHSIKPILGLAGGLLPASLPGEADWTGPLVMLIYAIMAVFAGFLFAKNRASDKEPAQSASFPYLVAGSAMTIAFYLLFYSRNSQLLQIWYSANFLVPICILLCFVFDQIWKTQMKSALSVFCLLLVTRQAFLHHQLFANGGPWPWHTYSLAAAKYLGEHKAGQKVGSWNAGIIAYYSGPDVVVVNLDGLVNNDIIACLKENNLFDYLERRRIGWIVDFTMPLSKTAASLGGYGDGRLVRALVPEKVFDHEIKNPWHDLTVYRLGPVGDGQDDPDGKVRDP